MSEIKVTVFKRGDGAGKFYMKYRDPRTGKESRKATGTKVRRDAERMAAKWEQEIRDGTANTYGKMPWSDFRERYELDELSSLADGTAEKAMSVFNVIESVLSPKHLRDINEESVATYQRTLREWGRSEATIKSHLAHLKAALNWAVRQKLLSCVPSIKMPKRAPTSKAKGRPLTLEEFERMILKTRSVVTRAVAPTRHDEVTQSWEFLLWGLWRSGLRLSEAMELHWTDTSKLCPIDLDTTRPLLSIPRDLEKANRDRELPMAPEFALMLQAVPERQRIGYVFNPLSRRPRCDERPSARNVGKAISEIGQAANVVVSEKGDKRKYASAHDLRRSFGQRWSQVLLPQQLKELMRHTTINTTLAYYVRANAKATADILWGKFEAHKSPEASPGTIPGTIRPDSQEANEQAIDANPSDTCTYQ